MARSHFFASLALLPIAFGACGGEDVCADVPGALAAAADGDVVEVGACRIVSDLTVPVGVTLDGAGPASTIVVGQVNLEARSALRNLRVESDGDNGVLAVGDETKPAIAISGVEVIATRGVAVRLEQVSGTLTDTLLTGPVTSENAVDVPPMPTAVDTATHGLLVIDGGVDDDAPIDLEGVVVMGFARFGALFVDSFVRWNEGAATSNLTVGVMVDGGNLDLAAVDLHDNLQGVQPYPAFGGVFGNGCTVTSQDLAVDGNEGYGVIHDGAASGSHQDLRAQGNGDAALWVQRTGSFALTGTNTVLLENALAGVVLVESPNAMVQDATIELSENATRVEGEIGAIEVGDGIHAVMASVESLIIDGVTLTGNDRTGILLDVADGNVDGAVMDVMVDGTGESLGVIAQGPDGIIDSGTWDVSVTRLGATAANDAALLAPLDIVGIVAPMFLPPPTM